MPIPYPLNSKSYGGSPNSGLIGYSTIPSTSSYIPGVLSSSQLYFGRHDFSSGRSPMSYGGGGLGFSSYSIPSPYPHVSAYGVTSPSSYGYGGYTPSSAAKSYYTPLPTITEHSSGNSGSGNKRRNLRTYIPVLPLPSAVGNRPALYTSSGVKTLFTEDIDVTTPRKTAKPGEISRDRNSGGQAPAYGTIRRGRTVIRLETKKLKENPYLTEMENKERGSLKGKENGISSETAPSTAPAVDTDPVPSTSQNGCGEHPTPADDSVEIEKEAEALQQLAKDYSHVTKWYEEEIRKPMKKEKNAGDKFREKYMVHSRKNKYAGYRRPTLSDIRAQKAVVMKEIEERLKKLTNVSDNLPDGDELPADVKAESEKLEKDKERLARLDKKMAKRFSRALKKAEQLGVDGESSDEESTAVDRQATVKSTRKSSAGSVKVANDVLHLTPTDPQGQRLTRKVTKRFFFPEEACSVVQPEIIENLVPAEPEDLFEKKILAQRNTVKMRGTQKKVYNINQRKSSASDLEISCDLNFSDNKLCDGEVKEEGSEPLPEILEEVGSPTNKQPLTNGIGGAGGSNHSSVTTSTSGKKKKYVKKVGDPPAKRVPGNILQPLVVPPKDSDSILDSPTEEDIKLAEANKNKKPVGKVNGLIKGMQQEGLLKHPLIKNNLKPTFMKPVQKNSVKKFEKQAAVFGDMPGKKTETDVVSKCKDVKNKEVAAVQPKAENVLKAPVTAALEKKTETPPSTSQEKVPSKAENKVEPASTVTPTETVKQAPNITEKKTQAQVAKTEAEKFPVNVDNKVEPSSTAPPNGAAKQAPNAIDKKAQVTKVEAEKAPEKTNKSPLIAKLKPKLALDNKSSSLDNNATPKLKLDNKSNSLDGDGKEENVVDTKKQELSNKEKEKSGDDKSKVVRKWQKPPLNAEKVPKKAEALGKPAVSKPAQMENAKEEDAKVKVVEKVTDSVQQTPPQPNKKEIQLNQKEQGGKKEDVLQPIKKVGGSSVKVEEKVAEVKPPITAPDVAKKVVDVKSPVTAPDAVKKMDANESSKPPAKQDLLPVKVHEKQQTAVPPKDTTAPLEKVEVKKKPALAVVKPEVKLKSDVKSPPLSPKAKLPPSTAIKEKVEVKGQEPKKKVPDEPKEKEKSKDTIESTSPATPKSDAACDDKSESLSSPPQNTAQQKAQPTPQVENDSSTTPKTIKEKEAKLGHKNKIEPAPSPKKDTPAPSPIHPLPNGHLSPPPSSTPKDKCANSSEQPTVSTTGKQQPSKSPQSCETTQKEGAAGNATGKKASTTAKVENLGVCTETNGPEKRKKQDDNHSSSDPVSISQDATTSQMNKLGNLSSAQGADEMGALTPSEKSSGDGGDDDDPDKIINAAVSQTEELKGESDKPMNPVIQNLIRKSVRRGSTHSSGGSSISSTSSTLTAKSGSGSSTGSSTDGQRRVPSPPIDDDSDEERITLDNCPAKTRPKYRKYEIEDFQFLKVLGKGSFGKVLLAELKGSDSYFAIKCLKKDVVLEDDDVECTMIERKVLLMGSKHPYLCHLFCTFQTESHLFFVMEYLNGGDLMFHIQQSGKFTEERARFYGAEIVSGLKFLHKRGVIYRDLKLDNILLDYEGHIRIADFGMCKLQIYLDRMADTFCGTPDYMSPEIIKGLRYNQCVDWWAFGVLMYEMLIGQSPFSGHDEDELFWSVCNEPVHYPRFLSKESKKLLELLLEKDPSKRLGTVGCIQGDVKEQQFFQPIDWERLEKRDLEPPFKPKLKHSLDVQYFDVTFTKEAARLTPVDKEILRSMDQTQFEGFSYTNPHTTD